MISSHTLNDSSQQPPWWLWSLMVLPRALIFFLVKRNPAYAMTPDSIGYLNLAHRLWSEHRFTIEYAGQVVPEMTRVPGYPLFLALMGGWSRWSVLAVVLAQCVLAVLTLWLCWRWLMALSGRRGALIGTTLLSVDLVYWLHTPQILAETLFCFTLVIALLSTQHALNPHASTENIFLSGGLWGLATMVKPILMFWPALMSVLWIRHRKSMAVFLCGAYLLPAMWITRNYVEAHYPGFSSQGGADLLKAPASAIEAILTHRPWPVVQGELRARVDQQHPHGYPDPAAQSKAYGDEARRIILAHPFIFTRWCIDGSLRILGGTGIEMLLELGGISHAIAINNPGTPTLSGAGTMAILSTHPGLIVVKLLYLLTLLFWYVTFLRGCWNLFNDHRYADLLIILGGWLYFLMISNHQGYYRYRIPMLLFLAGGTAVSFPSYKNQDL